MLNLLKVSTSLLFCISIILLSSESLAFLNPYPKLTSIPLKEDAGTPLILTPLIEKGKIKKARMQANVELEKKMSDVKSYAGYFTVDKIFKSNMFFWFFPAQTLPKTAPVVLWLQGGPGASSLFGLFTENGPLFVDSNSTLQRRKYSWNINHNMIYIDNPVGTGYSFTDDDGYCKNETKVGENLYSALIQFFTMFPELQENDFYVTGESYAGKYVPAVSHTIHVKNPTASLKINLKGLAIGNGLTDPINQLNYGDYLYQLGLIDFNGRDAFHIYEEKGRALINQSKYVEAFEVFNNLMDGDGNVAPTLFENLTGFNFYFNYLHTHDNNDSIYFGNWIQRADVRRAIHVGNSTFNVENLNVEVNLKADILKSQASNVVDLLEHYKVLVYNGELDIIVAYPLTENYLYNLNWPGINKYKIAKRKIWKVDGEIAGYIKVVDNLQEVLVRNAGHMVPSDQPKWAFDLISRFTRNKKF